MNHQQAESLAADLNREAAMENTGWTFLAVQAHNHDTWAVSAQDEDGTPTDLWVSPDLSFPVLF